MILSYKPLISLHIQMQCTRLVAPDTDSHMTCSINTDSHVTYSNKTAFKTAYRCKAFPLTPLHFVRVRRLSNIYFYVYFVGCKCKLIFPTPTYVGVILPWGSSYSWARVGELSGPIQNGCYHGREEEDWSILLPLPNWREVSVRKWEWERTPGWKFVNSSSTKK